MYACVGVQFGMERRGQDVPLTYRHDVSVNNGQLLHVIATAVDVWRSDEGHRHSANALEVMLGIETAQLAPVGIAPDGSIHAAKMLTVQKNHSGAGAEGWQSVSDFSLNRLEKILVVHNLHHRSALTAWQDESILRFVPVGQVAHKECLHSKTLEHLLMFSKCSLQC